MAHKWEGIVSTTLEKASADQIWFFLSDSFGIANWFPGLDISYGVSGKTGVAGCIRYNTGTSFQPVNPNETRGWSTEIVQPIDSVQRTFTYHILESNIGFYNYYATFKVVPTGKDGSKHGCRIDWSWSTDPVQGTTLEAMKEDYQRNLITMGKTMEDNVFPLHLSGAPCKWEGIVSTELEKASADQIWHFLSDFFRIANWFPGLDISYGVSGTNRTAGCVRYNSGTSFRPVNPNETIGWSKELVQPVDSVQRTFTYHILESNIGFYNYFATFKVVPTGKDGSKHGCRIDWSWSTDPVQGTTLEAMKEDYQRNLITMGKTMEDNIPPQGLNVAKVLYEKINNFMFTVNL